VIAVSSVFVAACSMVIALSSLGFAIHEAHVSRQHDRLSVQPYFFVSFYFDDTGVGWKAANDGLGPARIRGFKVLVDGVPQKATNTFPDVIRSAFKISIDTKMQFLNPYAGSRVAAGSSFTLAWARSPSPDAAKITDGYNRISFEVCYCSIYDECWLFSSQGPLEARRDDACSTFANEPKSIWWEL
jgi:hypothetical protein